ncbi:MAG: aminotransferase class III-fold pyridoxal phosphate-dependent enzyme [Planctomycetota bacterium]|nr:MAG: aminotransferase class III-fold pyridoxal phosphate-dependent enzyme [Planctomycetota bacterium]
MPQNSVFGPGGNVLAAFPAIRPLRGASTLKAGGRVVRSVWHLTGSPPERFRETETMNAPLIRRETQRGDAYRDEAGETLPGFLRAGSLGGTSGVAMPVLLRGRGAHVIDADGNEYIDYVLARGALPLGHADDRVTAAVTKASTKGIHPESAVDLALRLAELLAVRLPGMRQVRWTATPTEARLVAEATARGHTKRELILDLDALRENGSTAPNTVVIESNRFEDLRDYLRNHAGRVAGIVIEPFRLRHGMIPWPAGYLSSLRSLCREHGILLIFDESLTGLHVPPSQRAQRIGIEPDLVILGPSLGGGLPLAACVATGTHRLDVSSSVPALLGVPLAAGVAVLQAANDPEFDDTLGTLADRLDAGFCDVADRLGMAPFHNRTGPIFRVQPEGVRDRAVFARFHQAMLDRGILLPPSPAEPWFLSLAHTPEMIDRTAEALREALTNP